ncbi:PAS domain S-box protein [Haloferax sp. MBLA0076]|uniref:histidine kinase n=1 Tax=Haloferax litoreum TaxID=2666140 RepID=A0A6A8GDX6_9EURY|nr:MULTISPECIES: PAS domain S-box protein [Haloferax]KAB1192615.1 PAS domain S-box protein [Haloferax sp. CBA1148]MRX21089.1 PAS domain S-box protein [Haloferax litoreum]
MAPRDVREADAPIHVLLVDDESAFAAATAAVLGATEDIHVNTVRSPTKAVDCVFESTVDCVVSEYEFDETTGIDVLRTVREEHPNLPFILFTRHGSESIAGDATAAGATGYLPKDHSNATLDTLRNRIRDAVSDARHSAERDRMNSWYEAIVEQSLVGLYVVQDGRLRYANDYLLDRLDYDPDEALGRPVVEFVADEDRHLIEEGIAPRDHGSVDAMAHTVDVLSGDGRPISMEVSGRRVTVGGEEVIVGSATDVTARLASERELRRSERVTRQVISSLPDMVFLSEPDAFDIVYINDTFEEVWGRPRTALYENPLSFLELVHVDDRDRLEREIDGLFADIEAGVVEERYDFEFRFSPEGTETIRWAAARAVPLFAEDGTVSNVLGVMTDLTDRIRREQELAQQNARLEAFARVLSHDIRGPLAVAQGRLGLAREDGNLDHFEHVERAHRRIEEVIDDVRSMACDEQVAIDTSPVALADTAAVAWEMSRSGTENVRLEISDLPVVEADESRVKRLFENLFRNAVEHASTSNRPKPDDAVEHGPTGRQNLSDDAVGHGASTNGTGLVIRIGQLPSRRGFFVEDDGPGIPQSVRDDIFDTGVSSTDDGERGLGLGIVRQIVHTHGWLIRTAESDTGGARFEILFDTVGDSEGSA